MSTTPRQHDDRDLRPSVPKGDSDGGRSPRGPHGVGPWSQSALAVELLTLAIAACSMGVLAWNGRTTGLVAVAAVTLFDVITVAVFWRSYARMRVGALEAFMAALVWAALIGVATVFYVLDWRVMGACVLALVVCILFGDAYLSTMRPDLIEEMTLGGRDGEGERRDDDEIDR